LHLKAKYKKNMAVAISSYALSERRMETTADGSVTMADGYVAC